MRGNGGIVVQVRVTVQAGRRLPSILSVPTKRDLTPQGCELDHPASYNQLGSAHRFLENFSAAETPFTKYIELIPNDPNPHDSYAELLMKMGRFDDSIKAYERPLARSELRRVVRRHRQRPPARRAHRAGTRSVRENRLRSNSVPHGACLEGSGGRAKGCRVCREGREVHRPRVQLGIRFSKDEGRRMKEEGSHARGGEQASAISLMCLWSVPQHPPSTLRCGHAFRSSRY